MVVVILCIVWYGVYIYTCKCACVCVYVHVLCGARGGSGGAVVVVSAVYMCMHIYVAAACKFVILIEKRHTVVIVHHCTRLGIPWTLTSVAIDYVCIPYG